MIRCLAVAALTVMFANPLPGQAAENGLSRNGVSLQNVSARNGITHDGITRNGADRKIGTTALALDSAQLVSVESPR
jgi:hypothetical protein